MKEKQLYYDAEQVKPTLAEAWIVFSIANEYDQPNKAFEELFWHKPTLDELKEYSCKEEDWICEIEWRDCYNTIYWVEHFSKGGINEIKASNRQSHRR